MIEIRDKNNKVITVDGDLRAADLSKANLREANLSGENLRYANLRDANLYQANLRGANLSEANLRGADLRFANLRVADLRFADLSKANLRVADLRFADLSKANLRVANLRGANLRYANLRYANLYQANLRGATLRGADLRGADLIGTCLDPAAPIPATDLSAFARDGDKLICWRTSLSQHVGNTDYTTPGEYAAPFFSVDAETPCHPGIYFSTREALAADYPACQLVRGYVFAGEALRAGDKYRAKRFFTEAVVPMPDPLTAHPAMDGGTEKK